MVFNVKAVVGVLGALLTFLGLALLLPMGVSLLYGEEHWWGFGATALVSSLLGGTSWYFLKPQGELRVREGFAIVAVAWGVLSLLGAVPFVVTGVLTSYTDAFFETMSGFTTTGATILGGTTTPQIEDLPKSFLFWRSLAHWLGGMGIIVLTLAILPILGVGGMQLFKAEVPGPSADKFTPRVKETAKRLWLIYLGITAAEVLLLLPVMDLFDAVNHAFATMATGGFSTKNGSVGQFDSAYIDWVITIFMVLAGMNFTLHYRLLRGGRISVWKDQEFRLYGTAILGSTLLLTIFLFTPLSSVVGVPSTATTYDSFWDTLRYSAFQTTSIITTTGFGTADYELWPAAAIGIILALFLCGGMAGSTGGGIKIVRHLLLIKNSLKEFKQLVHPQAVIPIRLNGRVVSSDVMRNVLTFFVLYIAMIGVGTLLMTFLELDLLSALGVTLSSIGNIGPAFGTFGPAENYAHLSDIGKWILSFFMMAGRLELFTVLLLFLPAFWRQ